MQILSSLKAHEGAVPMSVSSGRFHLPLPSVLLCITNTTIIKLYLYAIISLLCALFGLMPHQSRGQQYPVIPYKIKDNCVPMSEKLRELHYHSCFSQNTMPCFPLSAEVRSGYLKFRARNGPISKWARYWFYLSQINLLSLGRMASSCSNL